MSIKLKKLVKTLAGDDTSQASRIATLEAAVGSKDTDSGSLKKRCADIETDVTALETAVGDSNSGLVKGVADINTAIGDAETSGTILYRLAQLEKE